MRAVVLPSTFATVCLMLVACTGVTELPVGSSPLGENQTASDGGSATVLDRLEQKCAAPSGGPDYYTSAAELTTRLQGRWYRCASSRWDLPRGTGVELQFGAAGSYAFITYSDATQSFTPTTDPDMSGQILYQVFTGSPPDGGGDGGAAEGGTGGTFIPVDDPTTRNGIFVYLTRADYNDYEFQMAFEESPRRLRLNELGGTPVFATFVPIDD